MLSIEWARSSAWRRSRQSERRIFHMRQTTIAYEPWTVCCSKD